MNIQLSERDDLFQDIILKLYKNLDAYCQQKGRFRSWLTTVIRNTTLNYLKKQQRHDKKTDELSQSIEQLHAYEVEELEGIIQEEWKSYILELAFERLGEIFEGKIIDCFRLTLENKSVDEISATLGITKDSVYTLRNRLKPRLISEVHKITRDLEF